MRFSEFEKKNKICIISALLCMLLSLVIVMICICIKSVSVGVVIIPTCVIETIGIVLIVFSLLNELMKRQK